MTEILGLVVGTVAMLVSRVAPRMMLLVAILAAVNEDHYWEYIVSGVLVGIGIRDLKDYVERIERKERDDLDSHPAH